MATGFEVIGVVLAAPTVIDLCIKVARAIVDKMDQNKSMKGNIKHLRILTIETGQARLRQDVKLVEKITASFLVDQQDKDTLHLLFDHAVQLLNDIDANVNTVLEKSDVIFSRKKRAALTRLEDQTRDLKVTLDNFHDMTLSLSISSISESGMFLDEYSFATIGPSEEYTFFNENAFIATGRLSNGSNGVTNEVQKFLLESTQYEAFEENYIRKNLERLSQRLVGSRSAEGILQLLGFRKDSVKTEFQLVFRADSQISYGETLQRRYRSDMGMPNLNVRIEICSLLAEAILHVHSLGLVHKNVRPENILLVAQKDSDPGTYKLFLLGWQYARSIANFQSLRVGESQPERRVYQHPERQHQHPEEDYCMGHDIYSLGVCMLEILTWRPLIILNDGKRPVLCEDFKSMYNQLGFPQSGLNSVTDMTEEDRITEVPLRVQQVLLSLGSKTLPKVAGCRMEKIVVRCLTCLESEDGLGGDTTSHSRNTQEVGADFVDMVLKDIRGIYSAI